MNPLSFLEALFSPRRSAASASPPKSAIDEAAEPFIELTSPPTRGYRFDGDKIVRLSPLPSVEGLPPLPEGLFVPPGAYLVGDGGFRVEGGGVHRFHQPGRISAQRLIRPADVRDLLREVGRLWIYGTADEAEAEEGNLAALATAPRVLGCARLSNLAVEVFTAAGFGARPAALMTLEAWNGQDDGHSLTEVWIPGEGWIAYDPSFNALLALEGKPRSLTAWVDGVRAGVAPDWTSLPGNPPAPFRHSGHDYGAWIVERCLNAEARRDWYRRMAGLALIQEQRVYYADEERVRPEDRPKLARFGYWTIPRRLYGELFDAPPGD